VESKIKGASPASPKERIKNIAKGGIVQYLINWGRE
jgi:hypothetical protein